MKKGILAFFTLLVVSCGVGGVLGYNYVQNLGEERIILHSNFTVAKGANLDTVITNLVGKQPACRIKLYRQLHPEFANVKSGTYDLSSFAVKNLAQALEIIIKGKTLQTKVQLIPGRTWSQWETILTSDKNLKNDILGLDAQELVTKLELAQGIEGYQPPKLDTKLYPAAAIEGLLFPETYVLGANSEMSQVLKISNRELKKNLQQAWDNRDPSVQVKTPYQLLILASIIEKEKGNDEEAPLISGVFNNRLKKGMLLQTDPTVIYGVGTAYKGDITRKHLQTPTPYNTYTTLGLPPTPITMVSKNSLEAAAHPAKVDYLYFMAVYGQGKHDFSVTYAEHERKVRIYNEEYRKANRK